MHNKTENYFFFKQKQKIRMTTFISKKAQNKHESGKKIMFRGKKEREKREHKDIKND